MLKLEDTKIKDADFTHEVVACHPDDHIKDILQVLKLKNIGSVIVINSSNQVLGLFSQRDYLIRVPTEKLDLEGEKVETYMNPNPLKLYLDSKLSGAISSLASSNSRHIILVDDDERPVGVLSQGDIIKYLAKSIKVLESTFS